MKIVIAGLGKVGYPLAASLADEGHDVTCIDVREEQTARANEALDVLALNGDCLNRSVLENAGTADADVFVAVTRQDEVNMLACLFARRMGARHTVARIRDPQYGTQLENLGSELEIDLVLNPEQDTAADISRLLRFPAALDIDTFHGGRVELVGFRVLQSDFLADRSLLEVQRHLGRSRVLICAVERGGETIIPNGSTVIRAGDKVYVGGEILAVNDFFRALGRYSPKIRHVMIVGGSRTAVYLTRMLHSLKMSVKIFEKDMDRCQKLTQLLPKAMIIHGDGTDHEVLLTENLDRSDAFVALTGNDESNLIVSLYAKQTGVEKAIAKVNRQNYRNIIAMLNIDDFINPQAVTKYSVLKYIRSQQASHGSSMLALYQIADGTAEAVEFNVSESSRHVGIPLKELGRRMKDGVLILSIQRGGEIIIPEGSTTIEPGDDVTVVCSTMKIQNLSDIFTD